jgi:hypothetical protein
MKVFVWKRIGHASNSYHSEGGVVVFAETEERAKELATTKGCKFLVTEKPNEIREVAKGEEKVFVMRDAGCC